MKVISITKKENYRKIDFADGTNLIHLVVPGIIVNDNVSKIFEHRNGYKYFKFKAECTFPSGKKQIGDCILLKKIYENPIVNSCFKIGNEIEVAIIVGGEYEGEAYIELENSKFSLDHFYPLNEMGFKNSTGNKKPEVNISVSEIEKKIEKDILVTPEKNKYDKKEVIIGCFLMFCIIIFVIIGWNILISGMASSLGKFPIWAFNIICIPAIIGGIIFFRSIFNDLK